VKVTVADRTVAAMTVTLTVADLEMDASFQAVSLCATGHPFRYLLGTVPPGSPVTESLWLARITAYSPLGPEPAPVSRVFGDACDERQRHRRPQLCDGLPDGDKPAAHEERGQIRSYALSLQATPPTCQDSVRSDITFHPVWTCPTL
jgi:hypothetical protein